MNRQIVTQSDIGRQHITYRKDIANNSDMSSYETFKRIVTDLTDPEIKPNGSRDVVNTYKTWAKTFDEDNSTHCAYNAPVPVVAKLAEVLGQRKDAKILDLGAGTGRCGELLQKRGFQNIDALDPSTEMLDRAREKGFYKRIICDYLGTNRLDIPDATYDGLVLAGAFVPNHATDSCFEELIRIMKPDGYFVFIISENYLEFPEFKDRFEPRIQAMEQLGHWKLLSREAQPYKKLAEDESGFPGLVFTLQRL